MKRLLTLLFTVLFSFSVIASDYKYSIGVVGGLGLGTQFKVMMTPNFTIIEELGYFTCPNGGTSAYGGLIDNAVFAYQGKAAEGKGIELSWFAGGLVKFGYDALVGGGGVFGFGGAGGIEANMKNAPIAFSFDFRPGYAFNFTNAWGGGWAIAHMFDWSINLGVRYTFPSPKSAQKKK